MVAAAVPGTFLRECWEGAGFSGVEDLRALRAAKTFQKLTWDLNPGSLDSKPEVLALFLSVWPGLTHCLREKTGQ